MRKRRRKLYIDVKVGGHSLRSIAKKTLITLKDEGPIAVARKGVIFLGRYSPLSRYLSGWAALHVNPVRIEHWYKRSGKKVTIVIPSYNDYSLLKKCIASIHKTTNHRKVDILVVDDYCREPNRQRLRELEEGNVKIIFRRVNGGFAKAVNTGMKAVKRGDIVLLNSDIVAKNGWLEALQFASYKFDPQAGIVGGKLLYPNGTIQFAGSHRNTDAPDWFDHYYRFRPANYGPANVPQHVLGITGACIYIRREVINKIGYMDEKFAMAFEDMDYCLRAWTGGWRSLYFPLATLIHRESVIRGREQGPRELAAKKYFWQKWGNWFDQRNVRNAKGQIRIIYVLQSTGVGGGIRIVYEHLNRLAQRGFAAELYSLGQDPTWTKLKVPHRSFKNYEALMKALSRQEAIKVATWWETAQSVWLASVRKGIPVFFMQDIESAYYPNDPVMQQTVISFYRKEFRYLTTSQYNKQQIAAELGHQATAVACGIDRKVFKPLKNVKRLPDVLLALGRGEPLKNFALTLNSWRKIEPEVQPRLWLFGVEPHLVKAGGKIKYFYEPSDAQVNRLYNRASVFAQTSRHEGFCLTALEAMAAGTPVVSTDSHGNRDYCVDGKNCLMIEQDNSEQMISAVKRLLKDSALQQKLRRAGYRTAARYDWPKITDRLVKFYRKVAAQK